MPEKKLTPQDFENLRQMLAWIQRAFKMFVAKPLTNREFADMCREGQDLATEAIRIVDLAQAVTFPPKPKKRAVTPNLSEAERRGIEELERMILMDEEDEEKD